MVDTASVIKIVTIIIGIVNVIVGIIATSRFTPGEFKNIYKYAVGGGALLVIGSIIFLLKKGEEALAQDYVAHTFIAIGLILFIASAVKLAKFGKVKR